MKGIFHGSEVSGRIFSVYSLAVVSGVAGISLSAIYPLFAWVQEPSLSLMELFLNTFHLIGAGVLFCAVSVALSLSIVNKERLS